MSKTRGVKFPAGNQDEDFSSDESNSSRNNSLYSRSDSENSSPRNKASGSSSLSSFTTTHATVSSENLSDPEVREDIVISNSDRTSDTDSDSGEVPSSAKSEPYHHQSTAGGNHQPRFTKSAKVERQTISAFGERITKTTSGLIIRHPTLNHRPRRTFWWNISGGRPENGLVKKMYSFSVKYHKEICVVLFLFASGFPFLRSKPLKTRSVQTPGPFFDQNDFGDLVEDHYKGEYVDLVQNKIPKAPSFVFYYAPWDSESLAAKSAFLEVARHFRLTHGHQIKFYAVNCWWPDGQCRQNYKNLSHYPIFVAHLNGAAGIIYNGPIRAELMIRFINLALRPVTRIDNEDELWRFRAQHDAVMLANFNFSIPESAAAYDIYLQMALRNLEADPLGQVGYAVFLRKSLADKYFVTSSNAISLVLFNEIHTAKWHGGFASQETKAPIKQVADWVMERTKSTPLTWAYRVRSGFSNRPVTLGPVDLAQELTNGPVLLLITRRYYPSAYSPFYTQVKEVALDYFNCNKSGNVTRLRRYTHRINAEWLKLWKFIQKICNSSEKASVNCEIMREQLRNWKNAETLLEREPLTTYEAVSSSLNFTGLSCRSSRPLRFLAIDPADIPHFIDLALGGVTPAASSLTSQEPLAFIIDASNNLVLPLTSFKTSELASAVKNYTAAVMSGQRLSDSLHPSRLWVERATPSKKLTNIEKLNAEQLLDLVVDGKEQDELRVPLFVMYTARFCGYCGVALAQFVSLANFLSDYNTNIRLARIDVFRNSLPAQMSVGELPSFVFFPATNRSDVRIFPSGEEITLKNLLKFVLSELDSKARIELSLRSPLCSERSEDDSSRLPPEVQYRSSRENTTKARRRLQESMGPEHCQVINRKLVTKQIGSVLTALQAEIRSGSESSSLSDLTWQPSRSFLLGLNKYKHKYFNGDKLYFMEEFSAGSEAAESEPLISDRRNTHLNVKNGYELTAKSSPGVNNHFGVVDFEAESVALWSHQLLDHLRSMRLFLDVA